MRFFLGFGLVVFLLGAGWSKYITRDGLLASLDKNPMARNADRTLYYLGKGNEIFSNFEKSRAIYRRVVTRYPKSKYAEEALFGLGASLEQLKRYPEALEEFLKYKEAYPEGKYIKTVDNNIEILRSR